MVGEEVSGRWENILNQTYYDTIYQILHYRAKAVLREKLTALNVYVTKKEKSQIKDLNLHLRKLEKE